jgi:Domain of unknown function (DUF4281)
MSELLFSIGNLIALSGWAGLLAALFIPSLRPSLIVWARFLIPVLLAIAYVYLIFTGREAFKDGGFDSLAAVQRLFAYKAVLSAGWLHYLAFDLFVGAWIVEQAPKPVIGRIFTVPCLGLTFLFGPAGLLSFYALRLVFKKAEA